ncbi:hypothetical protein STRCI_001297 [Streptomyces cinnabarinus]|uniref:Uncharacterized protein n=1 Tax=Streptomyces cinnabarinus TaxID=67287 RepID=A0ABY7KAP2_9ACTN|nr:hypothetical protein [Streptomyces cinnabarinus]WAZ20197.1 hypothetical protein STRCI_001297 [Streptomyces cinnabarinus]
MSARETASVRNYWTQQQVLELLDDHRAEVLTEAADMVHAMADPRCTCGGCDSCTARNYAKELRSKVGEQYHPAPLVVSRFDVAMEPAPEEEPVLTVGAVAQDGRPVALCFDPETRAKVASWLALGEADTAELERLRVFARATERRNDVIRALLARVDICDSAEAWDLGMAVIAIVEGPLHPDDETAPRLADFEIVDYSHRDQYRAADEYRCRKCGAIGAQGTEPKTLADLIGMVLRHECLPHVERGGA